MYTVKKWDVFELTFHGPKEGNPFVEQWLKAEFQGEGEVKQVTGFYDGDGVYRLRFMPSFEGEYAFHVKASFPLKEAEGRLQVLPAASRGPVSVAYTYHFAYADGTLFYPVGTTCYAWIQQEEAMREETLVSLAESPFNKIRMCVFPKHYDFNFRESDLYPYEALNTFRFDITKDNFHQFNGENTPCKWDFHRFNPAYFQRLDQMVERLMNLGIEADIILFHPYDRWGFSNMSEEENLFYVRYVAARLSAYRNVWWSLANEWDLMHTPVQDCWEKIGLTLTETDPYHHLISSHNWVHFYDHSKPWITHCCIQGSGFGKPLDHIPQWRERYRKPVIVDEMCYEGNLCHGWGNIDGQEMVHRFWACTVNGAYGGHGETFRDEYLWWSHGGKLHGESAPRLAFLKKILEECPAQGLKPVTSQWGTLYAEPEISRTGKDFRLHYCGVQQPAYLEFYLDEGKQYRIEALDTWEMTVEDKGVHSGKCTISMPQKKYMAVRLWEV